MNSMLTEAQRAEIAAIFGAAPKTAAEKAAELAAERNEVFANFDSNPVEKQPETIVAGKFRHKFVTEVVRVKRRKLVKAA